MFVRRTGQMRAALVKFRSQYQEYHQLSLLVNWGKPQQYSRWALSTSDEEGGTKVIAISLAGIRAYVVARCTRIIRL